MMRSLVERYRMGMITDDHLVVESIHMLDPDDPGLVLSSLPDNVMVRVLRFANEFVQGRVVTNYGVLPTQDQVLAAARWIENTLRQKTGISA